MLVTLAFIAYTPGSFDVNVYPDPTGDNRVDLFRLEVRAGALVSTGVARLPIGAAQRFTVQPGVYWLATVNKVGYAVGAGSITAQVKSGKDPWPRPPPPPPPFVSLRHEVWQTYVAVVNPTSADEPVDFVLVPTERESAATPSPIEITPPAPAPPETRPRPRAPHMRALLIGADQVPDLPPVPAAVDAVTRLSTFLAERFHTDETITALVGGRATVDGVRAALADAAAPGGSSPDDLFVLLFAGHGGTNRAGTEQYWQLADGRLTDTELAAAVNAFEPAVEVVVIGDSCSAAGMNDVAERERVSDLRSRLLGRIEDRAAFVFASSARATLVHVDGTSEFVTTLSAAARAGREYGFLHDDMRALVPCPREQASWSILARPWSAFGRPAFARRTPG